MTPLRYAQGTDSVDAKLTPREAVLNRNAAELIGRTKIAHMNAFGNHLAQRGIDLPTIHAQYGTEDVNMNNPLYYQGGTNDILPGATSATGGGANQAMPQFTPPSFQFPWANDPKGYQANPGGIAASAWNQQQQGFAPGQGGAPNFTPANFQFPWANQPGGYAAQVNPGGIMGSAWNQSGVLGGQTPMQGGMPGGQQRFRGGGGRGMRMFQEGTSDVPWEPTVPPLWNTPSVAPPVAPPAPPVTPVTAAARRWTPEQQKVVDRIYSGREDYTFGPGSPNPSKEDLGTYVRGPHAPAAGFQQERGVAIPRKQFNLFTPDERRELGIMDIAPDSHGEGIERWYGTPTAWAGGGGDPGLVQRAGPTQGSFAQIQNGVYSMDPQGDYAKATAGTSPGGPSKFGEGVGTYGKAISGLAAGFSKSADEDTKRATSQALSMISGIDSNPYAHPDPLAAYYAALQNPTTFR